MIYIDPPYGVNFGSNFQPFVRRRDVKHNDDGSLTREPEMVQAYRDTWELGIPSYLTICATGCFFAESCCTSRALASSNLGQEPPSRPFADGRSLRSFPFH